MKHLLWAGLLCFGLSCTTVAVVKKPPPAPQRESIRHCGLGYAWIPGHWAWRGGKYVWVPGHCKKKPRARSIWVPGHWEKRGRGWVWIPGHWK